jgi:hypothetical protein
MVLNRSIAKAEAIHLEHQSLALQNLYPGQGYSTKHVAGSITTLARPDFGWKLNHTSGFAVFGKVTSDDLRTIEAAFERNGIPPRIDMCDFADTSAFDLLSEYTINGSLCEYQQSLPDFACPPTFGNSINISILGPEDHDTFVEASNEGFLSGGRPPELLKVLAEAQQLVRIPCYSRLR